MSDETRQDQRSGRSVEVGVHGAGLDELELNALDEARKLFGAESRLEVQRTYRVQTYTDYPAEKRYHANITVREM